MKSDVYRAPETGLVGSTIDWAVQTYHSVMQLINEDQDRTNMVATMLLLLLFVWGWVYTSLTQTTKNPRLQKIERKVQESHQSITTIMDTLHLIKAAHENNVKCDQLVGQHLIDCLAHGGQLNTASASSSAATPEPDMLGFIETVEKEIHEIQHSKVRLNQKRLPSCFSSTAAGLAAYPSVCERLLKHELLSETEPDLTDCQSTSSTAEQTTSSEVAAPTMPAAEAKISKPVISSPLKCVSSAVNEIEAKTTTINKPLHPIGGSATGSRRPQPMRSLLPQRKSTPDKKVK